MAVIEKYRNISPGTRKAQSFRYRVPLGSITAGDELQVTITHEDQSSFKRIYCFNGSELTGRKSIHFQVTELGGEIRIDWSAVKPTRIIE